MELIRIGETVFDRENRVLVQSGREVPLPRMEFLVLNALSDGRAKARGFILTEVFGYDDTMDSRLVDQHVSRLRKKLGKDVVRLVTVNGLGYRLKLGR